MTTGMQYEGTTDAALLRLAEREPEAFSALYARHVEAVYRWLAARIQWAAADLTAETFARAWFSRRRFRDDRDGSALPWLFGIARNLLADALRNEQIETRARKRLGLPLDLATEDGYASVDRRLSPSVALQSELDSLAPHERDALELRVIQELSYDEIAKRLQIRPAAARLRVSRALRRLANTVPKEETQ